MYNQIDHVLDEVKARLGNERLAYNAIRHDLSKSQYEIVLQVLYEILQQGVSADLVFVVRQYFVSKWAKRYYRDLLEWTIQSSNVDEILNFEGGLELTYHKREAEWTMNRIVTIPPQRWPSSILRLLVRDLGAREDLIEGILVLLASSQQSVYILCNLVKIEHEAVLSRMDAMHPLPRLVRKRLDIRLGRKRIPSRGAVRARDLSGFHLRHSTEMDDGNLIVCVRAGFERLDWKWHEEWSTRVELLDGGNVPDKGYTLLLSALEDGEERWVVASREDETTLAVLWLSRPEVRGQ